MGLGSYAMAWSSQKWTTPNAAQTLSQFHSPLLLDIILLKYGNDKRVASNGNTITSLTADCSSELSKLVTHTDNLTVTHTT
jgi:hypothetical protein